MLVLSYEEVTGQYTFPIGEHRFQPSTWTMYQRADGSGRHVLAFHGQATWAGDDTPVYERFFAGGFRSMRGFEFRGVGPEVDTASRSAATSCFSTAWSIRFR